MLRIRLQRVGRKHDPSFRIVLTDRRNATKSGKFLEVLGSYNARFGEPVIKADRVKHWIGMGAQPTDTVHNLLIKEKVIEGKKINVLPKKSPIVKEVKEEEKKEEQLNGESVEQKKDNQLNSEPVEQDEEKEDDKEEKTEEPKEEEKKENQPDSESVEQEKKEEAPEQKEGEKTEEPKVEESKEKDK